MEHCCPLVALAQGGKNQSQGPLPGGALLPPTPRPAGLLMSPGGPGIQASANGGADLGELEAGVLGWQDAPFESGVGPELRWQTQRQWAQAGARTGPLPDPAVPAPGSGPRLGPLV